MSTRQILKVYIKALTGTVMYTGDLYPVSHMTISRLCPQAAPSMGKTSGLHSPRTGEGVGSLQLPASSYEVKPVVMSSWWPSPTLSFYFSIPLVPRTVWRESIPSPVIVFHTGPMWKRMGILDIGPIFIFFFWSNHPGTRSALFY